MSTDGFGNKGSVKFIYDDGSINNVLWKIAKCTDQKIEDRYNLSGIDDKFETQVNKGDIADLPTPNKIKARLLIALIDNRFLNEVTVIDREINQWDTNFKSKLAALKKGGEKELARIQAANEATRTRYRSASPSYSSGTGTLYTCTVTCKDRSVAGSLLEIPKTIYGDFDVNVSIRAANKYDAKEKILPNRNKICRNARGFEHFLGSPVNCR